MLKELQQWFSSVITSPLDKPIEGAERFVAPSPTLEPNERMRIYNQQYFWRLLNVLHKSYPFLTRLFGYTDTK
jgi:hypothetical protein